MVSVSSAAASGGAAPTPGALSMVVGGWVGGVARWIKLPLLIPGEFQLGIQEQSGEQTHMQALLEASNLLPRRRQPLCTTTASLDYSHGNMGMSRNEQNRGSNPARSRENQDARQRMAQLQTTSRTRHARRRAIPPPPSLLLLPLLPRLCPLRLGARYFLPWLLRRFTLFRRVLLHAVESGR